MNDEWFYKGDWFFDPEATPDTPVRDFIRNWWRAAYPELVPMAVTASLMMAFQFFMVREIAVALAIITYAVGRYAHKRNFWRKAEPYEPPFRIL
jgi:hypothetical protein